MWFKNVQLYRLPKGYALNGDQLEALLRPGSFAPTTSLETQSQGWIAPRDNRLVHSVDGQMLIQLCTEKKLLPSSVVNQAAKERAAEIEHQQGFAPGRKQMREIKEQVTDELLPRAFATRGTTWAWIDTKNGWLAIDAAAPSRADDILKHLLKAFDQCPVRVLRVMQSPLAAMTSWLSHDEAPHGFTVDQDTELRAAGEGNATVRYIHHELDADAMKDHVKAGKQCTRLAMTWCDRISFVLTESMTIKRIEALDVLTETDTVTKDQDERFDSDFVLMTGELSQLFNDLIASLGGEVEAA